MALIAHCGFVLHNTNMLNVQELKAQDLQRLSPDALAEVAAKMLQHIIEQSKQIDSQAQAIKSRDVKIERITFEETLSADQASLEAQLEALQGESGTQVEPTTGTAPARQPKR